MSQLRGKIQFKVRLYHFWITPVTVNKINENWGYVYIKPLLYVTRTVSAFISIHIQMPVDGETSHSRVAQLGCCRRRKLSIFPFGVTASACKCCTVFWPTHIHRVSYYQCVLKGGEDGSVWVGGGVPSHSPTTGGWSKVSKIERLVPGPRGAPGTGYDAVTGMCTRDISV